MDATPTEFMPMNSDELLNSLTRVRESRPPDSSEDNDDGCHCPLFISWAASDTFFHDIRLRNLRQQYSVIFLYSVFIQRISIYIPYIAYI